MGTTNRKGKRRAISVCISFLFFASFRFYLLRLRGTFVNIRSPFSGRALLWWIVSGRRNWDWDSRYFVGYWSIFAPGWWTYSRVMVWKWSGKMFFVAFPSFFFLVVCCYMRTTRLDDTDTFKSSMLKSFIYAAIFLLILKFVCLFACWESRVWWVLNVTPLYQNALPLLLSCKLEYILCILEIFCGVCCLQITI